MRLHRLALTAFGPFATAQEVDFDELSGAGIFLLHGPTGAGKTSVLDAVCYALYGSVPGARQNPGTTLRSDHAAPGTPTEVTLELTVGGRRLEFTRRPAQSRPKRKGTGRTTEKARSELREYDAASGGWKALSRSHQEIGEEVKQLLGMVQDQFCQVVLLPQGDFARFLRADAEARGKLLGRLFDTRRFAAVEERLAEQRRSAEQRVRQGDERLLAVAQRIAQAAGDGVAGARSEAPPPEGRPGDVGLAPAVLEWAALTRSAARERADIAASALMAAERGEAAARRALDTARAHEAARERYTQTLRRAAELEARRPEHDLAEAALRGAHRAELVAPALALRDEADRAHRDADRARASARALLPADRAEAGAEQLAALERSMRQELGALDAAGRDEERDAAITAERAELDRQARADEEIIAETEDPAGWESRRRALQGRVEAAQEAAARAERLVGQLEPAVQRLAAARRRDTLDAELAAALRYATDTASRAVAARQSWLDLREERLNGMAAELAARLVDGAPCAVCGSADHPAPARAAEGQADSAAEDAALTEYQRADAVREEAESAHAAARERRASARAQAGDSTVAELAALVERLEGEHERARRLAGGTHAALETLARAEREYRERLAAHHEAERRVAARTSRCEVLDSEQDALRAGLTRARGDAGSVAERRGRLAALAGRIAAAAECVRAVETTALRLKEADDRLAGAAFRAGFDTPRAAAEALLTDAERSAAQRLVDAWQREAHALAERRREPEAQEAAARPPVDMAGASEAHRAAEAALRAAASAVGTARERCSELARLSRRADAEVRALGPVREEYDRVARLAGLTAGTSGENERRMRLESYVLAARLEQVAAAATVRLRRMSSGRYGLVHSDARVGGRGRSGLGLRVVDAWTGRERDTATLSGGETFFASLALALGLADVVTEEAGGVRLDTLFIDEGFGSLDEQALDEVLDVLDSLRERDRSVGIVSHVADLRRRIPAQLEIVKDRRGSLVRPRRGTPAR
ncbi:AAA family ATPase [Streptomyces corynorhini]|uniref:Nuclease SbcCD subunit C n=1 Tax=Streptomyces corynorhini TaxID=2282652 RepID=A0A370B3W4_9ACTN|nr:SMC family ATPase [Streptomyces corynorhini]RDG35362.1 SMC family ATPase [Streptomyces corynorhini]